MKSKRDRAKSRGDVPSNGGRAIEIPKHATIGGREVLRVWLMKDHKLLVAADLRSPDGNGVIVPTSWGAVLDTIAKNIAAAYARADIRNPATGATVTYEEALAEIYNSFADLAVATGTASTPSEEGRLSG